MSYIIIYHWCGKLYLAITVILGMCICWCLYPVHAYLCTVCWFSFVIYRVWPLKRYCYMDVYIMYHLAMLANYCIMWSQLCVYIYFYVHQPAHYIYTQVRAHAHTHTHTHTHTCSHTNRCACTHAHTHTHTHARMHTHTHTHVQR